MDFDPEEWEREALEDEFRDRKIRSPYACSDRMCGAPDCRTCYPGTADETYGQEMMDEADSKQAQEDAASIPSEPSEPPWKHCKRCDAPSYDLNAGACWNCDTEFE